MTDSRTLETAERYMDCPFCGITTFDRIGLKRHFLNGHCDVFNDTPMDDDGRTGACRPDLL